MQKLPLKTFFGKHRVIRWMIRLIVMVILGCIIGILALPVWRDYKCIRNLGVGTYPQQREAAITAASRANVRPEMMKRLIASLDTPDQTKFLAVHDILFHFRKFNTKHVEPIWIDRYNLIELEIHLAAKITATMPAENKKSAAMARCTYIFDTIINSQDNEFVRRMLELTHNDPLPEVRQAAAALAAKLGDDAVLKKLLADENPQVAADAVLGVFVASRNNCLNDVIVLFNKAISEKNAKNSDLIAACAITIANMQVQTPDLRKIIALALETKDEVLQEKLSLVLPLIADQDTCAAMIDYFKNCSVAGKCPNAMMLLAGAKMNLPIVATTAKNILAQAIDPKNSAGMMQAHIIAAINTLDQTGIPCRREIYDFVKTYWQPGRHLMLIPAAQLLGKQAVTPNQPDGAPTKEECFELLRHAATWVRQDKDGNFTNTPLASAGAAVAAWKINPAHIEFLVSSGDNPDMETMKVEYTTAFLVREVVTGEQALPGDYVAWHIGMTHSEEAFALGQWMLPDGNGRVELNPDVRSTGALLLAFAANSADQRATAEARIERRINREDFFAKGSCQCALLTIWPGREVLHEQVRNLLWIPDFPQRRVWTALMSAGDKTVLDSLLLNMSAELGEVADSFVINEMNEVVSVLAPALVMPSVAADNSTRLLQMRLMRMQWACGRNSIKYGLPLR